jgi:hypothetical protein
VQSFAPATIDLLRLLVMPIIWIHEIDRACADVDSMPRTFAALA